MSDRFCRFHFCDLAFHVLIAILSQYFRRCFLLVVPIFQQTVNSANVTSNRANRTIVHTSAACVMPFCRYIFMDCT